MFSIGPAILVTAAFIGPGTVMTASSAGNSFGFLLLWSVAFSVFATIVLQEMAARLGIVTGTGLSQALNSSISQKLIRGLVLGLVLVAILIGNAAYQTGNILGAATGVLVLNSDSVEPESDSQIGIAAGAAATNAGSQRVPQNIAVMLIGTAALLVIWIGRFDVLQMVLTLLVASMSLLFVIAAFRSHPDWSQVAFGFVPRIPQGAEWIVVGLIGTTVVPYNLFLHASAAAQRWHPTPGETRSPTADGRPMDCRNAIASSRLDTVLSVLIGGVVTCAILITSSVAFHSVDGAQQNQLSTVQDVATQLEPALGAWAKTMFAIGLFAAGLTSAITAPIAAGYAASGCFGWSGKLSDWRLKTTASLVVLAGIVFAILFGASPKQTIILAQVANGLLLPIIAVCLLIIVNRTGLMKQYRNRLGANLLGVFVIIVVTIVGVRNLYLGWEKFQKLLQPVPLVLTQSRDRLNRLPWPPNAEIGSSETAVTFDGAGD